MSAELSPVRKIIHVDMDAFFASVEQRDNPEYRDRPLVVGGSPDGRGGVVAAASYEARKFGIRSAMPSARARQLCPTVLFVKPRFAVYKEVSGRIREIFRRYTDLIEPLSLDEAYLDVSADKQGIGSAIAIAQQIREAIRSELQLTASAGVSVNKFVAKVASDMNKPDGLTFIAPHQVPQFMEQLPVEKFFGVGKVTAARMKEMGLHTGAHLKALSEDELVLRFGKSGRFFYNIVRGIDNRPIQPNRISKSVGAEDTFAHDLTDVEEMNKELSKIAAIVAERLQRYSLQGRTITLKIKYSDFRQITRRHTYDDATADAHTIADAARTLLSITDLSAVRIRLLGITVSGFYEREHKAVKEDIQIRLF